jgi:exopolysaccharide production protein ExoQ
MAPITRQPREIHPRPRYVEWVIVSYLIFSLGAIVFAFHSDQPGPDQLRPRDNILYVLVTLSFYIGFALVFAWSLLTRRGVIRDNLRVLAFAILCPLSVLWSVDVNATAIYGTLIFVNFLSGVILSWHLTLERFLQLLYLSLKICVSASFLLLLIVPHLMLADDYRPNIFGFAATTGVFPHKNATALACGLGLTFAISSIKFRTFNRDVIWAGVFIVFGMASGSANFFVLMAVALAFAFFPLRLTPILTVSACLVAAFVISNAMFGWGESIVSDVATTLGRDANLTGRNIIWERTMDFASMRPWLGYGFEAFFRSGSIYYYDFISSLGTYAISSLGISAPPHAHNSFIQILITLGVIGLLIFSLLLILVLHDLIRIFQFTSVPAVRISCFCSIALMMIFLYSGIPENSLMSYFGTFPLFVSFLSASAFKLRHDQKSTSRRRRTVTPSSWHRRLISRRIRASGLLTGMSGRDAPPGCRIRGILKPRIDYRYLYAAD